MRESLAMNLLKTLLFTLFVPGSVTLLVPYLLYSSDNPGLPGFLRHVKAFGAIAVVVGACIYAICAWDFVAQGKGTPAPIDPPRALVSRRLYRLIRNPMYLGVLAVLLGESLLLDSAALLIYTAVVFLGFHLFVIGYEEPRLRRRFGEEYMEYRGRVPRWFPRVGAWLSHNPDKDHEVQSHGPPSGTPEG